jgi:hypothetical protein
MDKHMIHIDDLVRQRLNGAEDPEIPGGWLRMKELLDKEMPVQTGVGWGRRRIIGYFAGILLLTTAGVGGYRYYSNQPSGIYVSGGSESGASSDLAVTPEVISLTMPTRDARSAKATENPGSSAASSNNIHTASNSSASTNPSSTNSNHNLVSNRSNNHRQIGGGSTQNRQPVQNNSNDRVASASTAAHSVSRDHDFGNAQNSSNKPIVDFLGTSVGTSNTAVQTSSKVSAPPAIPESNLISNLTLENLSGGSVRLLPVASSTSKAMLTPRPVRFRFETIETIEVVHHRVYDANTQKNVFRIDTFPRGKTVFARAIPQPEPQVAATTIGKEELTGLAQKATTSKKTGLAAAPALASTKVAPAESAPVPQSSATSVAGKTEDGQTLESLASHKTSSKQFRLWDADKIDEAVNKFKFNLARIQVYPGVMGGINASIFTPNALGGFQIGLTSLVVMNDWWTLMGELKYMHRFNTGSTVHDDYTSVIPGSGSTSFVTMNGKDYKAYDWKDQSVEHYFNFDAVQTLEMPLALRYSWGRVYAMGGVNLMYSLPIQASEVTHFKGDTVVHRELRPATHDDEKFVQDDAPIIKLHDFGPQFGVGYLLGGGFMFTPAVYMDLRVAQTFWSNGNTTGSKQISNDLLRTPSLQLSVGYRFAQKPR